MDIEVVKLSPKYQIVIPAGIRKRLHMEPGKKIILFEKDGRIYMTPMKSLKELRGALKGVTTEGLREHEPDRLD